MKQGALWALCLLLALGALSKPASCTFFIIGQSCVLALDSVNAVAGAGLAQLGADEALRTVRGFCAGLRRFSLVGQLTPNVASGIERLLEFVGRTGGQITNRLPELAGLLNELAGTISLSGR